MAGRRLRRPDRGCGGPWGEQPSLQDRGELLGPAPLPALGLDRSPGLEADLELVGDGVGERLEDPCLLDGDRPGLAGDDVDRPQVVTVTGADGCGGVEPDPELTLHQRVVKAARIDDGVGHDVGVGLQDR